MQSLRTSDRSVVGTSPPSWTAPGLVNLYSTRFLAAHDQAGSDPVVYVVPAGKLAIVRDVDCYAGTTLLGVTFFARGSAGQVFWSDSSPAAGAGWKQWQGRQVLYAGESLSLEGDDTCDLAASGYLLDAP